MKALKLSAFVLLAAAVAYAGDQPEYITKEVTGEAAIEKGDKLKAKEEAKKKALREAVEQVAGVLIGGDTQMKNNVLVKDLVYAKSEGFVRKYDVLSEKEEAGVMKVTVKAEVGTKGIDQELAVVRQLVAELGKRTVGIVLQEQTITPEGTYTSKGIFADELNSALKSDGWKVVQVGGKDGVMKLGAAAGQGNAETKEIDMSAADFILVGQVGFKEMKFANETGMYKSGETFFPVEGDYAFQVYIGGNVAKDTNAREVLTSVSGRLNASKDPVELKQVNQFMSYDRTASGFARVKAREVVALVRKGVVAYLLDAKNNGRTVAMSVSGLGDYRAFTTFKKSLEKVNGVKAVRSGTLSDGKGKFDIVFAGTTDELAEKLAAGLTFNKRAVAVTGTDATSMELTLK